MTSGYSGPAHSLFRSLGAGSRVAGYLIEEQIGTGGMAVVFMARDEMLGRLAAVKVIAPSLADDGEFRMRFLRESRAAAAVDSPYIVPVYGAGEAGGLLYIATRFVAGGDLAGVLRRAGGRLAPDRAAWLVGQVAAALDAAHAAGLVHRDVKPQNILVETVPERDEHVYLSDFGLSKGTASTGLTASGEFLGTPDYCAPEQVRSAAVDGRADQYALGCVAFALLTGTAPFHREETLGTLFAHVQDPVPPVTGLRPELPPAADAVIARVLAKSPEDRYARCGEFAAALQEALSPDHPATVAGRQPWPDRNGQPADRSKPARQGGDPAPPPAAPGTPALGGAGTGYADTVTARNGSGGRSPVTPGQHGGRSRGRGKARAVWAAGAAAVLVTAGTLSVVLLYRSPPASPGQASQGLSHPTASRESSHHAASHPAASQTVSSPSASAASSPPSTGQVTVTRVLTASTYGFEGPDGIASDGTHIWVTNGAGNGNSVTELNASDGSLIRILAGASYRFDGPGGIALDGTHIWVANYSSGSVTELNASDGSLVRTLTGFETPVGIACDGTHIWVTDLTAGTVTELNAGDGSRVRTLTVFSLGIAFDGTHLWIANGSANSVTELNASDGSLVRTLKGAGYPFNTPAYVAFDGTHIWVSNNDDTVLMELNPSNGSLIRTLTGSSYGISHGDAIAVDQTHMWLADSLGNSVTELTLG